MEKFTKLTGVAAPMPMINIDTDMIIPKQFLKSIKRTGYAEQLFFELRYDDDGKEIEDFVLNKPAYRDSKIIVAGENFGCGSSREHAPWALLDFGIRCVENQEITGPDGGTIKFDLHPFLKECLINGLDDIGLTMKKAKKIDTYEEKQKAAQPWL